MMAATAHQPSGLTDMYLFDDRPELALVDPIIVGGAILALAALIVGLRMRYRMRRRPPRGPAYQVFRADAATALTVWGGAQLLFVGGWALRVEGLRMPIWSYLGLLAGVIIAALLWRRERAGWPPQAKAEGEEVQPDGSLQRGRSRTWEVAFVAAGGAALVGYLATADHGYAHPVHWLTTAAVALPAYALGMAAWTPRMGLVTIRASRSAGTPRRPPQGAKRRRTGRGGAR
jgi:hypothetical protein